MYFVEVILPLALAKTFTYSISEAEYQYIKPGMRIAVPFGKSKIYTALAVRVHEDAPTLYEAKEIHLILDENPVVTDLNLKHWQWISQYYMCSIGEVMRCALPSALLLESETVIAKKENSSIPDTISDDEYLILEALEKQSSITINDVSKIVNKKKVFPVVYNLFQKNAVSLHDEMIETYTPKLVKYIKLNPDFETEEGLKSLLESLKGSKQKEIVLQYFQLKALNPKPISQKLLLEKSNASAVALTKLVEKEIFEVFTYQEDRVIFAESQKVINLSNEQEIALNSIKESFTQKDVTLLHGVTSSGKTEIYIKLIDEILTTNAQVLYLLPEIALTTQLVSRLTQYFGNKVAVFHSKYSNNERVEVWNNVLQNSENAQVVIGARSALFLPFQNLKLIIVDEEHEQNFKQQDPAPRYHARDAAIVLALSCEAKVLLGSATPSIETFYNCEQNKYGYVALNKRFGNAQLPNIELVDLKDAHFRKKLSGHFSSQLIEAIGTATSNGEQVILFQNRRGYSPVMECLTCGHVPQCTNCDVSLTYHKFKNQLRCHYCGYAIAKPSSCHACSSIDLTTKGFGTEQVELELAALFPSLNIKRMDQDTTRGKYSFEKLIESFKNQEIDVLVGTQMLAKGLDFSNVSLVGILNADNMLYHPDFRSFERSFQMLTQVAGRAGRSDKIGNVIIQTYNPLHNIIQQVTQNNYLDMYKEQVYERRIFQYPPYFRLIKLTIKCKDFEKLKESSLWLYQVLKQSLNCPVLGPEEPVISKIRNEYLRTILIKIPIENNLSSTKKNIEKTLASFETISQYRSVKVVVNVDFY